MYSLNQLRKAIQALKPGTPITLQVSARGGLIFVSFTLEWP
jgi:hypothetical protein